MLSFGPQLVISLYADAPVPDSVKLFKDKEYIIKYEVPFAINDFKH